jgi:hypothetical protein
MSAEQEETVKTQKFNRLLAAKQAGEITTHEFRDSCNRDNLFPITLDTASDTLNPDDPDVAGLISGEDEAEEDAEGKDGDPGADKEDTESPKVKGAAAKKSTLSAPQAPKVKNSAAYEKAAYMTDGGDSQFTSGREAFLEKLAETDPDLWQRAIDASIEAFGTPNIRFAYWWYKRNGGKKA